MAWILSVPAGNEDEKIEPPSVALTEAVGVGRANRNLVVPGRRRPHVRPLRPNQRRRILKQLGFCPFPVFDSNLDGV